MFVFFFLLEFSMGLLGGSDGEEVLIGPLVGHLETHRVISCYAHTAHREDPLVSWVGGVAMVNFTG